MTKKDYREKIEEHRQEIELDDTPSRMSRSNKKQSNYKSNLLRNLTIAFILIPALVLIYVTFFYEPKMPETTKADQPPIEIQTNKPSDNNSAANTNDSEEEEKAKLEAAKKEKEAAEAAKAEEAEKKAKEEEEKLAQQKAKEEEQKKLEQQASSTTYTVKPGDTLYSISRAHYNGEIRVQGIIQANNLSTESITVGQVLIIPK